jgi:hypothetical protein
LRAPSRETDGPRTPPIEAPIVGQSVSGRHMAPKPDPLVSAPSTRAHFASLHRIRGVAPRRTNGLPRAEARVIRPSDRPRIDPDRRRGLCPLEGWGRRESPGVACACDAKSPVDRRAGRSRGDRRERGCCDGRRTADVRRAQALCADDPGSESTPCFFRLPNRGDRVRAAVEGHFESREPGPRSWSRAARGSSRCARCLVTRLVRPSLPA